MFEISKIIQTLIRIRLQGMYWCAHKTATLTSFQHTVPPPPSRLRHPCNDLNNLDFKAIIQKRPT